VPTMQPSTAAPTEPPFLFQVERTRKVFANIALEFSRARNLNAAETDKFETLTKQWFEGFFEARSGRRKLQISVGLRNMKTNITVTSQKFLLADPGNGRPYNVNKITYSQTIDYIALENARTPEEYVLMPFRDSDANSQYRDNIAGNIDALRFIESVPIPKIEGDAGDGGLGTGAIVGIALGAVVVGAAVGFFAIRRRSARRSSLVHKEDKDSSILRPDAPHDSSFDPTNTTDDMPPDAESGSPRANNLDRNDNVSPTARPDSSSQPTNTTDESPPDADTEMPDDPVVSGDSSVSHKDQGRSVPLAQARLLSED